MPPIEMKDTKAPASNQPEAPAKEMTKLPPTAVLPSQVCSVISLVILVTIATGRAILATGYYVK